MGEREGNSYTTSFVAGACSTQPSTICDPTKSPNTEWLGTIVVGKYRVGMWKRGRGRMVCGLGREVDLER